MAKKINKDDMVYTGDFANIMGLSTTTIRSNVYHGYCNDIRTIKTPKGMMFHIFDIFQYAHPNASKDAIERMIFDYRMAKGKAKKAERLKAKKLREKKRGVE